ncbi:MAG: lysophospholipase, partial [Cytophagales bacterium]|nr:lysophospholipase [Cytophagales bacterium]
MRFKLWAWTLAVLFIIMNAVSMLHAYKFTHFIEGKIEKTKSPDKLSLIDKLQTLVLGVSNPKPKTKKHPSQPYKTVTLQSNKKIEIWHITPQDSPHKGTVIIFHGYSGDKSSMLDRSDEFIHLGYHTLLVDFMGSGGSEGNQCTVGYKESENVKTVFDYLSAQGERNIYLYGTSMGAVAILKSIHDEGIKPKGIIIECPFGSMYQTTCARFKQMGVPCLPMAGFLVFWGGALNGFWALGHSPTAYAKKVNCPTL